MPISIEQVCIDCDGKLSNTAKYTGTLRCKTCFIKARKEGKIHTRYVDGRTLKKYYCNCGNEISLDNFLHGNHNCRICAATKMWKDEKFRNKNIEAQRKGRNIFPNFPEKQLGELLGKDYKFVGDGGLIIDGFCPDFVNCNGQKKIVEMYGDYWHNLKENKVRDKFRIKKYKNLGYETLIIWEKELQDLPTLKRKIEQFNYA